MAPPPTHLQRHSNRGSPLHRLRYFRNAESPIAHQRSGYGASAAVVARNFTVGETKTPRCFSGAFTLLHTWVAASGAGQFLVGGRVDDLEVLGVHAGVGPEVQLSEVALLHLVEDLFVLGAQTLHDRRMDDDAKLEV